MGISHYPTITTQETPFSLVYGTDALLPIELGRHIAERTKNEQQENDDLNIRANLDVLEEVRELARITSEATKRRVERKYKTKVKPRCFQAKDLVLRRSHAAEIEDKLSPKDVGPFRIKEVLRGGAYQLETLNGTIIPRTWNAVNLHFYFS